MNTIRLLIIVVCVGILSAVTYLVSTMGRNTSDNKIIPSKVKYIYLTTVEHDKHLFIVVGHNQGILHHPDCECLRIAKAKHYAE